MTWLSELRALRIPKAALLAIMALIMILLANLVVTNMQSTLENQNQHLRNEAWKLYQKYPKDFRGSDAHNGARISVTIDRSDRNGFRVGLASSDGSRMRVG